LCGTVNITRQNNQNKFGLSDATAKNEVPCYPSDHPAVFSTDEGLKSDRRMQLGTQQDLSFRYQQALPAALLTQHSLLMPDVAGCPELTQLESICYLLSTAVNEIKSQFETNAKHPYVMYCTDKS